MDCPNCKLVNPPSATRCDCGYDFRTPTLQESEPAEHDKQHVKKGLASVFKSVTGIAGLVFLMAPITNIGILVSVIALVVAIITGVLAVHLSEDKDHVGYWPRDPSSRGSF